MSFLEKYGPVAVIAGGSEGVGAAYADMLAARGLDLVLVARKAEPLEQLRETLAKQYPERKIDTLSADLTDAATPEAIFARTAGREVGLLIYNAGSATRHQDFVDNDIDFAKRLTALNAVTPMLLTHHYGKQMKARGKGGIIVVGSFAGFVGNPSLAIYSASKAFSATLLEALWYELKPHGVDVLGHILGSTDTPFIARNFPQAVGFGEKPEDIAASGLAALAQGPIVRARGGDEFFSMLNGVDRGAAVKTAVAAGENFLKGEEPVSATIS